MRTKVGGFYAQWRCYGGVLCTIFLAVILAGSLLGCNRQHSEVKLPKAGFTQSEAESEKKEEIRVWLIEPPRIVAHQIEAFELLSYRREQGLLFAPKLFSTRSTGLSPPIA